MGVWGRHQAHTLGSPVAVEIDDAEVLALSDLMDPWLAGRNDVTKDRIPTVQFALNPKSRGIRLPIR